MKYVAEPFRIKSIEPITLLSQEERMEKIKQAHYNLFHLRAEDVYIDLLTDSGTGAMSIHQWAALMQADESYAGAKSYLKLQSVCKDLFDYAYIQPVHQGRAAEKVLFPLLLSKGKYAISNTFFDTTRAHVELCGAIALDSVVPEALDPSNKSPFKGNMDIAKMISLIENKGKEQVGVIVMTITNNSAGGQPVSMQNLAEVYEVAHRYKIPVCIDGARFSENAYFIKQREQKYANHSIREIVVEQFSFADMFIMSAKKDAIVNMGGLIGVKESPELITKVQQNTISYEGFITYGGLSGRDLETLAVGLIEGMEESYLAYRIGQVEYIASRLDTMGIAYQSPPGGHGIFIDAQQFFPQIPYDQFPAHTLAVELYIEAGIRTCDIGSYMLGNDPITKTQLKSMFEFTRLAIPRRVYTQSHLDVVCDALGEIKKRAQYMKGYRIIWEPDVLRHFQAHLEPIL